MSEEQSQAEERRRRLAEAEALLGPGSVLEFDSSFGVEEASPTAVIEKVARAIMVMMYEGAAILDNEGRILHCNARLGEILERPCFELIGRSFATFVDPSDAEKWQVAFGHYGGPVPLGFTLKVLVREARPVPVHIAICSLGEPPGRVAFLLASDLAWQEERMRQLERLNRQLEEQLEALEVAATTDSTTGAYAPGAIFDVLDTELAYSRRYGYAVSALLIDIDHFKALNDSYGHAFGDSVLKEFCERCRECIRGTDYLVRYGGDEFVVILPQTGEAGAKAVGERILEAIRSRPFGTPPWTVPVTVSVGMATAIPEENVSSSVLFNRADQALYEVKGKGRNGMAAWHPK